MDFDWNCLLGKFHPSQLTCKTRGRVYKTRCSEKTVCINDIQRFYRVKQNQYAVVLATSG